MFNKQVLDQTIKGAISAAAGWICTRNGMDAGYSAGITVVVYHFLAQISKAFGLKGVANFFATAETQP